MSSIAEIKVQSHNLPTQTTLAPNLQAALGPASRPHRFHLEDHEGGRSLQIATLGQKDALPGPENIMTGGHPRRPLQSGRRLLRQA
eukprot:g32464.t1